MLQPSGHVTDWQDVNSPMPLTTPRGSIYAQNAFSIFEKFERQNGPAFFGSKVIQDQKNATVYFLNFKRIVHFALRLLSEHYSVSTGSVRRVLQFIANDCGALIKAQNQNGQRNAKPQTTLFGTKFSVRNGAEGTVSQPIFSNYYLKYIRNRKKV